MTSTVRTRAAIETGLDRRKEGVLGVGWVLEASG